MGAREGTPRSRKETMSNERFEWLEVPAEDEAPLRKAGKDKAPEMVMGKRCPQCNWLDEDTMSILPDVSRQLAAAQPGAILMLENTRKYEIERALWKTKPEDLSKIAFKLTKLANEFAEKIGTAYVFEAFSAGSLDASSVAVPAAIVSGLLLAGITGLLAFVIGVERRINRKQG